LNETGDSANEKKKKHSWGRKENKQNSVLTGYERMLKKEVLTIILAKFKGCYSESQGKLKIEQVDWWKLKFGFPHIKHEKSK
jgi:hypothetical protein